MAGHLESFSSSYYQPESPKIRIPKPSGSGLTLVIPSLKNLKAQKSAKETPRPSTPIYHDVVQVPEKPKIQRPVKLKPLKEVLSKLIAQLKKKDDYAFFLHPVDVANVAGYADIVKRPMDFGTMGEKVARGRYRSLEDFADDLRLVTGNAKLFNPPGSIYHTEADKLEAWGLDHIARAAPTVIQYETDWNIDVEKDDEAPVDVVDDEEDTPAMDKERERSVSVMSQSQQPGPSTTRRGPRGPYKRQGQNPPGMSETLEPDGGLPGSKDGLGAFPAGSDWAKTMLALKRKGKRYKTKKERLRFEKEGPPMCADGSLDYSEMEDPFSVLSYFVPDGPSRPHLAPLFPTSTATTLPPTHTPPSFPFLEYLPATLNPPPPQSTTSSNAPTTATTNAHPPPPRRRHWVISRNATWRGKGKEREDDLAGLYSSSSYSYNYGYNHSYYQHDPAAAREIPEWQMPREMHALDVGAYAALQGGLALEMRRRGIAPVPVAAGVPVSGAPQGVGNGSWNGGGTGTPTPAPPYQQTEYIASLSASTSTPAAPVPVPAPVPTPVAVSAATWAQPMPQTPFSVSAGVSTPGTLSVPLTSVPGTPVASTPTPVFLNPNVNVNGPGGAVVPGPIAASTSASGGVLTGGAAGAGQGASAASGGVIDPNVENATMIELIKERLDVAGAINSSGKHGGKGTQHEEETGGYWTPQRAAEAEAYVREVVYGGVEGLAYVRSLAEFVDGRTFHEGAKDPEYAADEPSPVRYPGLGMPLAKWVEMNIVDPLTEGRHALLRRTGTELARQTWVQAAGAMDVDARGKGGAGEEAEEGGTIAARVAAARETHPHARTALAALQHIAQHKIDMGALIRTPDELFLSEEEWVGKGIKERRRLAQVAALRKQQQKGKAAANGAAAGSVPKVDEGDDEEEDEEEEDAMEVEEPERTWAGVDADAAAAKRSVSAVVAAPAPAPPPPVYEQEGPEELREVLEYVADRLVELDQRNHSKMLSSEQQQAQVGVGAGVTVKSEETPSVNGHAHGHEAVAGGADASGAAEDTAMRHLRLNLLALAKRAPLDTIARLPKDLVPEHIRNLVPTLGV